MSIAYKHSFLHFTTDTAGNKQPKKLGELNKDEMHELIDHLGPRKDMLAGISLFHRIIDKTYTPQTGCTEFLTFMGKAREILSAGKILRYDFEPDPDVKGIDPHMLDHAEQLKHLPMTRRAMLRNTALGTLSALEAALAASFLVYGAAQTDKSIHQPSPAPDTDSPPKRFSEFVMEHMDKNMWGPLDFGIGIAFGVDAGLNIAKIRAEREEEIFEQISNAVAEFSQRVGFEADIKPETKRPPKRGKA